MASIADPHLASLQYAITPLNYSGEITLSSGINGDIINDGVERYKQLNQQHLKPLQQGCRENLIWVSVETTQSAINIVEAANHKLFSNGEELKITGSEKLSPAKATLHFKIRAEAGKTVMLEKSVAIYTSKTR
jgi:trehalose/maltose hydrolase-like predicted phosphorylase